MAVVVTDNPEQSRYEVVVDDVLAGFAEYHLHTDVIAFIHTEIKPEFGGQGLASALIGQALDDVRTRSLTVQPFCPFVRAHIKKHREYRDLVREAEWERFDLVG